MLPYSNGTSGVSGARRADRASLIDVEPVRLVITDAPSNNHMEEYLGELIKYRVKHVVRACEPTYDPQALRSAGIEVHELQFEDGCPPSDQIRDRWLDLVEQSFVKGNNLLEDGGRIAVHCVAGLGRAPVLVALALMELCGMSSEEAIEYIRKQRRGAINTQQVNFLIEYKPTRRVTPTCSNCTLM